MRAPSKSKLSTGIARYPLALAFALLASCASLTPPAPPQTLPPPPRIDCDAGPSPTIPPVPPLAEMDAWAAVVMGVYQVEVTLRTREHKCLNDYRAKGVIR